jgi:NAD(P)H-nitrite reductase large subunit
MRYVIIGASIAGISAAAAIRENDPAGEITVISGERAGPYYRPLIPLVVAGKKSEQDITYAEDPLQGKNIVSILETATGVDVKKREVRLASGQTLPFDKLLLASGGVPLKPVIPGLDGPGVYPLRNMAQAIQIREAARNSRNIVVIGGGLVGIKAALALRELEPPPGKGPREITVVEMLPQILSVRIDRRGSEIIRAAVVRESITMLTGTSVLEVVRKGQGVTGVKISHDRTIKADMVVVAAGVRPNISYLRHSGIKINRGVLVDAQLRTNIEGIYAAGDAAEGRDLLTGASTVGGLWSNAREMGRAAGISMAGGKVDFPGFLPVMNATEIAGIPFISVGLITSDGDPYKVIAHEDETGYWKLVIDGNHLIGAVFVGDLRNAGIYTSLIRNRIPISAAREKIEKRAVGYVDIMTGGIELQA